MAYPSSNDAKMKSVESSIFLYVFPTMMNWILYGGQFCQNMVVGDVLRQLLVDNDITMYSDFSGVSRDHIPP